MIIHTSQHDSTSSPLAPASASAYVADTNTALREELAGLREELAALRSENDTLRRQIRDQDSLLAELPEALSDTSALIRESKERFRLAFENAAIGMALVAPEGPWLRVNAALCAMLGYSEQELLTLDYQSVTHPNDWAADERAVRQLLDGEIPFIRLEKRYRHKQGHFIWVLLICAFVRDLDNTPLYYVSQIQDITERKVAETSLRESEERFRLAFDHAGVGMALVEHSGAVLRVNPVLCAMLGYSEQELLTLDYQTLTHPDDFAADDEGVRRLSTHQAQVVSYEKRLLHKDGSRVPILLTMSLVFNDAGQPHYFVSQVQDLSERKRIEADRAQLERKMEAAQRLESLGVLAGGIAHDFNNLLVGVHGYIELASHEIAAESEARAYLAQALASTQRASELTGRLLAYSGRGSFAIEPVDVNTLVVEMRDLVQVSTRGHAQLAYQLAETLPPIQADLAQLRQVVLNIVTNAAEAIEGSGLIAISTAAVTLSDAELAALQFSTTIHPGGYVRLTVQDSGKGMDASTLERIFDPFFSTKFAGRGLGLAAVQGIVRGHGGALGVASTPGQGTTFQIFLPAAQHVLGATAAPAQAGLQAAGTILVIDDEPSVRAVISRLLKRLGFTALCAADGLAGIKLAQEGMIDLRLVLLDATMPELGGLEVAAQLRQMNASLPIVLMSGYSEDDLRAKQAHGVLNGFVQKPFAVAHLTRMIRELLG